MLLDFEGKTYKRFIFHGITTRYAVAKDGDVVIIYKNRLKKKRYNRMTNTMRYRFHCLSIEKKRHYISVHRMVLMVWKPNPLPHKYQVVNHIDKNVENNHVDNLEWCTQAHNVEHSSAKHYAFRRIDTGEIIQIFNLKRFCRENNLCPVGMSSVASGKQKTSQGYAHIED